MRAPPPAGPESIVVIGAGGHAKVVIELARAAGLVVVGCVGKNDHQADVLGAPVIGGDEVLQAVFDSGTRHAVVAIGANDTRVRIGQSLTAMGFSLPPIISPSATVSPSAVVGIGVVVMAGAVINADCRIGDHVIINTCASVDHDGQVGDGVHIAPGARLAGSVTIGNGAMIGVGATILPGLAIGAGSTLGGGSTAITDIPANVVAVGSPARLLSSHRNPSS
jgi:UDP-perosamine 4-acetyltransferase